MIGKIERLQLREIWKHEAHDFTAWLSENIDVISNSIDFPLENPEKEQHAGSFSVDIVAEDESGNPVIIENQLEKSDHDHLGKLITYLTSFGAKNAIWIVSEPRPEHVQAITWLNEASSANFYLVKAEAIKIGGSDPAPLLTLVVGPSEESKEVGDKKKEMAERHVLRKRFWEQLLLKAKQKISLHASITPQPYSWIGAGAGKSGMGYNYSITQHQAKVELYIDRGKDSEEENKLIFERLKTNQKQIEQIFGEPLNWESLEGRRACRISKSIEIGGWKDEEKWPDLHDKMINAMCRLEEALKEHVKKLNI